MSLASSSCKGLVVWLILNSKKFEFFDSKTRFYKLNSASQAENAFSRRILKFDIFFKNEFDTSKYHGKCIPRPTEHPQTNPIPSINIWNDFENFEFFHLKKKNFKHFISNFNVILRFWGHGGPKNDFFKNKNDMKNPPREILDNVPGFL